LSIQKVLRQSSKTATKIDINQDAKIFGDIIAICAKKNRATDMGCTI
jgi:hypothetical protein